MIEMAKRWRSAGIPLAVLVLIAATAACRGATDGSRTSDASAGGGSAQSDARALEIAGKTLEAMGGREAWDATRYLTWNYLGRRQYLWDRWDGRVKVRSDTGGQPVVVSWSTREGKGRAWVAGEPLEDPGVSRDLVRKAHENWINDSYWLVMPYKLRDPGVVLRYIGRGETIDGREADILEMTFEGVGMTPENRYLLYVGVESSLIEQWDVYGDRGDAEPRFRMPWRGWQSYGSILLSGDRGERKLTDIAVHDEIPDGFFENPDPPPGPS